jgi:hypothetical protein
MKEKQTQEHRTSIKKRFIIFSAVLFLVIFIGGSAAFAFSMWQILHNTAGNELIQSREMGAVDYIKKPYDKDDLLRRVGKIVKQLAVSN